MVNLQFQLNISSGLGGQMSKNASGILKYLTVQNALSTDSVMQTRSGVTLPTLNIDFIETHKYKKSVT